MALNLFDIQELPIAELRKLCAVEKVPYDKTSTKEDLIRLLNTRRKGRKLARLVTDPDSEIPPGFVRGTAQLQADGTDTPIPILVNNFRSWIPRGVMVDIPKEAYDTLRSSTESKLKKELDKEGNQVLKSVEVPCYPFDKIGEQVGTSGAVRPSGDARDQRLREQYRELYGRWPRRAQFNDWKTKFVDQFEQERVSRLVEEESSRS